MNNQLTNGSWAYLLLAVMLVGYGCAPAPTESEPSTSVATEDLAVNSADEAATPAASDAYPVPDGDAQQLTDFINELSQTPPKGDSDEAKTRDLGEQLEAKIVAAERLAAATDDDVYQMIAARTSLESLRVLRMIGRQDAGSRYDAYLSKLAAKENEQMKFLAEVGTYHSKLDGMSMGSVEPPEVIKELAALLDAHEQTQELLEVAMETAGTMAAQGMNPDAVEVGNLIAEKFRGSDDPRVTQIVEEIESQQAVAEIGELMQKMMMGDASAKMPLVEKAKEVLSGEVPLPVLMSLMNVSTNLEYSGNVDEAKLLYEMAGQHVEKIEEEVLREQLGQMVSGGLQRVEMVGKPFEVTGQTLDGSPFNWSDYRGKVVLVDFWATWCGPCIQEIPNVKSNYDTFNSRGFEVVGINLDDDPESAKQFLESQELPWATVISDDPENVGFKDPNATRYSVLAIPFLVLVDADGNVAALHVRGEKLTEALESMLPSDAPTESEGDEADGDVELGEQTGDAVPESATEDSVEMTIDDAETLPPDVGDDDGDGQ